MKPEIETSSEVKERVGEEPQVLEEIAVEELSIDGICGVY